MFAVIEQRTAHRAVWGTVPSGQVKHGTLHSLDATTVYLGWPWWSRLLLTAHIRQKTGVAQSHGCHDIASHRRLRSHDLSPGPVSTVSYRLLVAIYTYTTDHMDGEKVRTPRQVLAAETRLSQPSVKPACSK